MKKLLVSLQTTGNFNPETHQLVMDGDTDQELHELLIKNDIKYFMYEGIYNFGTMISLLGTVENLKQVLHIWDALCRDKEEVLELLKDWNGDDEKLTELLF